MQEGIGLDFETYGGVSLPDHGLERYVRDDTFLPLIAATYWKDHALRGVEGHFDFVLGDRDEEYRRLYHLIGDYTIDAHNAGFERAVLYQMGMVFPADRFIDSAVVSRAAGGGSSLEAAAPQLLNMIKLDMGKHLIKLFSIPGRYQEANGDLHFDPKVVLDHPDEWKDFMKYCVVDAQLSYALVQRYPLQQKEYDYAAVTMEMNDTGWPVDVEIVEEMQRRYIENQEEALHQFRLDTDSPDLNLNSLKQLKEWCKDRGISASSFDEKAVERIRVRLEKKLTDGSPLSAAKRQGYEEVLHLMHTKQMLGGSSLKKLATILNTQHEGRLKDQYLHIGAGQSWRTTGRSVQMQNLKRLAEPANMDALLNEDITWSNEDLALNLRQVFTSSHPQGALIVGDFSSVESRGLAWASGATWKTDAYRVGKDMYKVLATKIFPGLAYDAVTKTQRQTGKVGELSCGYGAGSGAVQSFASGMGIDMTEAEAASLVNDWRLANPETVVIWEKLNDALHRAMANKATAIQLQDGFVLEVCSEAPPLSLERQHPGTRTVVMRVQDNRGKCFMIRRFHGCYYRGKDVNYYKPTDRKTGAVWSATYTNPKTKQLEFHKIYGGKMTGILVQSFCRELFMMALLRVSQWVEGHSNLTLIGQFHDEIVLDWVPGGPGCISLEEAKQVLEEIMSASGECHSFPMAAEIKHDYRYTK